MGSGAFLYTIPTFQNPTGRTLPLERREAARQAREGRPARPRGRPVRARPLRGQGRCRPCSSSRAGRTSSTARRSRRRSRRACGSATSSCPRRSPAAVESAAASAYITPALLSQATVYAFLRRGKLEPSLERVCGLLRDAAGRDDRGARAAPARGDLDRPRGRLLPVARASRRRRGGRPAGRGRHVRARAPTSSPARAERARSGSRSATSRPRRSRKACGGSRQPSAPRMLLSRAA